MPDMSNIGNAEADFGQGHRQHPLGRRRVAKRLLVAFG
jgi:hypothetical protein